MTNDVSTSGSRSLLFLLGFAAAAAALVACEGGSAGTALATSVSPLESCSGGYACTSPRRGTIEARLSRDANDACAFGSIGTFASSGEVDDDEGDVVGHWTGNAAYFTVCWSPDDCMTCAAEGPSSPGEDAGDAATPSPAAAPTCQGSPDDCRRNEPPSCSDIQGCWMESHPDGSGGWNDECGGTADPCDTIPDETHCRRQGCEWR
jgi:hypothetical protein